MVVIKNYRTILRQINQINVFAGMAITIQSEPKTAQGTAELASILSFIQHETERISKQLEELIESEKEVLGTAECIEDIFGTKVYITR